MTQIANNNLSVLPFHMNIEEQNHRKSYAYGDIYPLYTPLGCVPSFQIHHASESSVTVTAASLIKSDGTVVGSILGALNTAGLAVYQFSGYSIIRFSTPAPRNITTSEGQYYISLTTSDGVTYYSDIFTVTAITEGFLNIQWWDRENFVMDGTQIVYRNGNGNLRYPNNVFLQTQLGKPDYQFDEEGEERDGFFYLEKMLSIKRYKFTFLASEPLCDVMRFISLSDFINIIDQWGNEYHCDTFLMTPKWQQMGNVASVEVEFTTDTVAKKIGRGYSNLDSFNNDYNEDYNITNSNN